MASVAVGFATLGEKRRAWVANTIVAGLAFMSVVAIHDIEYLPAEVFLLPLAISGTILASLFAPGVQSFFGRPAMSLKR